MILLCTNILLPAHHLLHFEASDKCTKESECLSFEQHMEVTSAFWKNHIDGGNIKLPAVDPTVVFTTESTNVVKEQQAFVSEKDNAKFPYKFGFITNTKDVTPDSGFMKDIGELESLNSCINSCAGLWLVITNVCFVLF